MHKKEHIHGGYPGIHRARTRHEGVDLATGCCTAQVSIFIVDAPQPRAALVVVRCDPGSESCHYVPPNVNVL